MKLVEAGKREAWEKLIEERDSVLDIGCWSGWKLLELSSRTKNLFGIDIDESKINSADPKIRNRLKVGDITKEAPFNRKFDWVILGEVLEHVSDDDATIKNISRSLKKGGRLILTTPRSVRGFQVWDPAWVRWRFLGGQRHYHYNLNELISKLRINGIEIKEYYIMGDFRWMVRRWSNVLRRYILKKEVKKSTSKETKGFCDWVILAEKIK